MNELRLKAKELAKITNFGSRSGVYANQESFIYCLTGMSNSGTCLPHSVGKVLRLGQCWLSYQLIRRHCIPNSNLYCFEMERRSMATESARASGRAESVSSCLSLYLLTHIFCEANCIFMFIYFMNLSHEFDPLAISLNIKSRRINIALLRR